MPEFAGHMPRALWWSYGGGGVSYERGTPVDPHTLIQWCNPYLAYAECSTSLNVARRAMSGESEGKKKQSAMSNFFRPRLDE